MRLATYLDAAALILISCLTAPAATLASPYEEGDRVVVTAPAQLQVQEKAVASVGPGESLTVESVRDDWLWVQVNGTYGWIESKYVKPAPVSMGVTVEARTVETFDRGRKWAVVATINNYLDPQIPSLHYCVSDGQLVVQTLTEHCGYEAGRILILDDDQKEDHLRPLGINLRLQIRNWLKKPRDGDTVLVFFSGHGFQDDRGQAFLAPKDCEKSNLGLTGFRVDELRDVLHQCKASQKVLILDSCHSGGEKGLETTGVSSQELGLAFRRASGMITLASCGKQEKSWEWEEKGHGLFTYFLAQGLRGGADYDRNRLVDSYELHRYVLDQVSLTAQKRLNVQQTPKLLMGEDVQGVFALARTSGGVVKPPPLPPSGGVPLPGDTGTLSPLTITVKGKYNEVRIRESTTAERKGIPTVEGEYTERTLLVPRGQAIVLKMQGRYCEVRFPDSMQGNIEVRMEGDAEYNDVYCPRTTNGSITVNGEPKSNNGHNTVYASQAIQEKMDVLGGCSIKDIEEVGRSQRPRPSRPQPPKPQGMGSNEVPPTGNTAAPSPFTTVVNLNTDYGDVRISESATAKTTGDVTIAGNGIRKSLLVQPGYKVIVNVVGKYNNVRFPDSMQGDIEVKMGRNYNVVRFPNSMQGNIEVTMGTYNLAYCPRATQGTIKIIGGDRYCAVYAVQAIQEKLEVLGGCPVKDIYERPAAPPSNPGSLSPLTIVVDTDHGDIHISESATATKTGKVTVEGENIERKLFVRPGQKVIVMMQASNSYVRFPNSIQGDIEVRMEGQHNNVYLPESMQGNAEVRMEGSHDSVHCPNTTQGSITFIGAGSYNTVYASQAIQDKMEVFGDCSVREPRKTGRIRRSPPTWTRPERPQKPPGMGSFGSSPSGNRGTASALRSEMELSFTVVEKSGADEKPIEGATVKILFAASDRAPEIALGWTTSEADGACTISLPGYWLAARGEFFVSAARGAQTERFSLDLHEVDRSWLLPLPKLKPSTSVPPPAPMQPPPGPGALKDHTNTIGMKFKLIPAGEFLLGSPENEGLRDDDEQQRLVRITKPLYLGTTEVTQGQWEQVMGSRPWSGKKYVMEGSDYAASNLSWEDAVAFCKKLSEKEGRAYRLPTEAEWEYACRAGSRTAYSFGDSDDQLSDHAWLGGLFGGGNCRDEKYAHPVGQKRSNAWGLYDMHGNVWEWCQDWYGEDHAEGSSRNDPTGPSSGSKRVSRGGSWSGAPGHCRSAIRGKSAPDVRLSDLGFRVALVSAE